MEQLGKILTIFTFSLNLINWETLNQIFICIISLLTIAYWSIKVYRQIKNKRNKKNDE